MTAIIILIVFCMYRFVARIPLLWDAAIVVALVYAYNQVSVPSYISRPMAFLGKHSFNIFLFHTFIYSYYFHSLIYWHRNPMVIVATLTIACILISICIEQIKKLIRFDLLIKKII